MKIYQKIDQVLQAIENCKHSNNQEWLNKHFDSISIIEKQLLPYGSGFDSGTTVKTLPYTGKAISFETSFHHMDENGYYDGWTEHTITITPSFQGFDIKVSGKNKNDIKNYIIDTFYNVLDSEYVNPIA